MPGVGGGGMTPPGGGGLIDSGSGGYNLNSPESMTKRNQDVRLITSDYRTSLTLKGLNKLTMTLNTFAPEYQTDFGFKINDHLALESPTFEITGTLVDEWDVSLTETTINRASLAATLRQIRESREPFILSCDFGWFDGIVITDFELEESSNSVNTFDLTMSLKQTVKAVINVSVVKFIYDVTTSTLVGTYTQTGQTTEIALTAFEAVDEEDRSILDNLWRTAFG